MVSNLNTRSILRDTLSVGAAEYLVRRRIKTKNYAALAVYHNSEMLAQHRRILFLTC